MLHVTLECCGLSQSEPAPKARDGQFTIHGVDVGLLEIELICRQAGSSRGDKVMHALGLMFVFRINT